MVSYIRLSKADVLSQLRTRTLRQLPLRGIAATVRRRMQREVGAP